MDEVNERFGEVECSFIKRKGKKDKWIYKFHTHRCGSKEYDSIASIPKKKVDYVSSSS